MQEGYRIIPPQDVFEPKIREACSTLFTNAENVWMKAECEASSSILERRDCSRNESR